MATVTVGTREVPAPVAATGVPAAEFRAAMRQLAASVVVVTVADGPTGFTASSFTSVSLDPPLVSFCVDRRSASARAVREAPMFAVNLLGAQQSTVAERSALPGDRFAAPTRWTAHPLGPPVLADAAGHLVCARHLVVPLGDHWLVAGLVVDTWTGEGAQPLLYHDRRYGGFRPTT